MTGDEMAGAVALVTGGTDGLGKETARGIARRGATVVVTGRDREKGERAVADLARTPGAGAVDLLTADFADQAAVRGVAERVRERYDRLDVLVNNAGTYHPERRLTDAGIERTFAVNHLAHFLLTTLLADRLAASAPARVVTVSSASHRGLGLDLDAVVGVEGPGGTVTYGLSKLANVLFTYELARRLEGTGVTATCSDPGTVPWTMILRDVPLRKWRRRLAFGLRHLLPESLAPDHRSIREGARTSVYLATSPDVAGVTGEYFVDCAPRRSSPESYDREAQRRLWGWSAELTGVSPDLEVEGDSTTG